jgi:hypothetical protein
MMNGILRSINAGIGHEGLATMAQSVGATLACAHVAVVTAVSAVVCTVRVSVAFPGGRRALSDAVRTSDLSGLDDIRGSFTRLERWRSPAVKHQVEIGRSVTAVAS